MQEPKIIGFGRTASEQDALDEYMLGFISREELIKRLESLSPPTGKPEGSGGSSARE